MKDPILPHSKQKYDWDCGIACSQMILSFMELYDANKLKRTMRDTLNLSTNIWTIDLAVILYLMGMDRQSMKFFSIYAGANPKHKEMSFYRNTSHEDDEIRINLLFHSLIHEKNSLLIEVKHLTIQDIIQEMKSSYRCVCIALIDATKMHCEWCTKGCTGLDSCIQLCNKSMGPCLHGLLGYCGHFILIEEFDEEKEFIYYHNPATKQELCCTTFKQFEKGRTAIGTDEDLLFVPLKTPTITQPKHLYERESI